MASMNELLANIIKKQKAEIPRISSASYVQRSIRSRLVEGLENDSIKVIIGPRRAGKSSLAFQVLKDKKFAYGILSYKRGLCENCLKGMVIIENEIKE